MADNKLQFETEDGSVVEFEILESTRVNGANYILVTTDDKSLYDSENDDEDSEPVFIMKDMSSEDSEEAPF